MVFCFTRVIFFSMVLGACNIKPGTSERVAENNTPALGKSNVDGEADPSNPSNGSPDVDAESPQPFSPTYNKCPPYEVVSNFLANVEQDIAVDIGTIELSGDVDMVTKIENNIFSINYDILGLAVSPVNYRVFVDPLLKKFSGISKFFKASEATYPEIADLECSLFYKKRAQFELGNSNVTIAFSKPVPAALDPRPESLAVVKSQAPNGITVADIEVTVESVSGDLAKKYQQGQTFKGEVKMIPEPDGGYRFTQDFGGLEADLYPEYSVQVAVDGKVSIVKAGRYVAGDNNFELVFQLQGEPVVSGAKEP